MRHVPEPSLLAGALAGEVLVLVNPRAAGGRAARLVPALKERLDGSPGLNCRVEAPAHVDDARALLSSRPSGSRCILVGGDGTVHQMLPALHAGGLELGLVPCGSGNDLARALGLHGWHWTRALERALAGRHRHLDLGIVRHERGDTLFASSCTAGFDSAVGDRALRGPAFLRGLPRYLWATIGELAALRNWSVGLVADGRPVARGPVLLASVLNTPSYGSGMPAVPRARADDGRLDLLLAGPLGRWRTMALLPRLMAGRHLSNPRVRTLDLARLEAQAPEPVPLAADGEPLGPSRHWQVQILPAALKVVGATDPYPDEPGTLAEPVITPSSHNTYKSP